MSPPHCVTGPSLVTVWSGHELSDPRHHLVDDEPTVVGRSGQRDRAGGRCRCRASRTARTGSFAHTWNRQLSPEFGTGVRRARPAQCGAGGQIGSAAARVLLGFQCGRAAGVGQHRYYLLTLSKYRAPDLRQDGHRRGMPRLPIRSGISRAPLGGHRAAHRAARRTAVQPVPRDGARNLRPPAHAASARTGTARLDRAYGRPDHPGADLYTPTKRGEGLLDATRPLLAWSLANPPE